MKPVVLIVDDEVMGRESLESLLITQDYLLDFAANGDQAITKACQIMPDVILLDVMMPGLDGYDVCRHLRSKPEVAEIPIVMVTALDDRDSRLMAIEAGADDFISKPIDRAELRARVKAITRLNRYRRLQDERAKLERQVERLNALHTIDLAITSSLDLKIILNILIQEIITNLDVDAAAVSLYDACAQSFECTALHGFWNPKVPQMLPRLNPGYNGSASPDVYRVSMPVIEGQHISPELAACIQEEKFQAYFSVPLQVSNQVKGIMEVFHRSPLTPDSLWVMFFKSLAEHAAIAIDHAQMFEKLQQSHMQLTQAYHATIEGWSRAMDLRDKETEYHTHRVTEKTLQLARSMDFSEEELVYIRWGALLHDIGKLGVPDGVLLKAGPLNDEEWVLMRKHPQLAYEMISSISYLQPAIDIPYCHHEKWNGSGYPRGLVGEQIPLAARIFAVVDVWDALRSDRPYREAWPEEKVRAYIEAGAGTHFDPQVVAAFLHLR